MANKVTLTYRAIAEPDENGGWFVYAPQVKGAHSQGRTLKRARTNIREAISLVLDVPDQSFDIDMDYGLPEPIKKNLYQLKELRLELTKLQEICSKMTEKTVEQLRPLRLSLRDEASLLGLSFQRVQQLTIPRSRTSPSKKKSKRTRVRDAGTGRVDPKAGQP